MSLAMSNDTDSTVIRTLALRIAQLEDRVSGLDNAFNDVDGELLTLRCALIDILGLEIGTEDDAIIKCVSDLKESL